MAKKEKKQEEPLEEVTPEVPETEETAPEVVETPAVNWEEK